MATCRRILEGAASDGTIKLLYIFQHSFEEPEAQELLKTRAAGRLSGNQLERDSESGARGPPFGDLRREGRDLHELRGTRATVLQGGAAAGGIEDRFGDPVRLLGQKLGHPIPYSSPEDLFVEWRGKSYAEHNGFGEKLES